MVERIEAIVLEGQGLGVTARDPLPVEPRVLALAAAIRVFERYPLLRCLTLAARGAEFSVSREEVDGLLGPKGFAALEEPGRWRQLLVEASEPRPAQGAG